MPPPKNKNQSKPLSPAIAAFNKGDYQQAEKSIRQVLRKHPNMHKALDMLGIILLQQRKNQEAIEPLEKASGLLPKDPEVWDHLGVAYMRAKELTKAAEAFDRSLKLAPDRPSTLNNAGFNLQSLGQYEKAESTLRRALELKPGYKEGHTNLGLTLYQMGRLEEALEYLDKSQELATEDSAETQHNIGCVYREMGQSQTALERFKKALQLDPNHVKALNNMGMLLKEAGKSGRAVQCYNKALENQPDNAKVHNNLGGAYKDMNRLERAVQCYRKALELEPNYANTHSNLLLCLNYLAHSSREEVYKEYVAFNNTLAGQVPELDDEVQVDTNPDKKLRLGVVSADLRKHSVAYFLRPFLENLDLNQFEIYCYYNNFKWDDTTDVFKAMSHGWVQCHKMTNEQLARQIQQDRIDILFDFSGHSGGSQLVAFAAKPAPIQVSWIGYPNTTGLKQMDYRLVDAITDPPGDADQYHTEKLIRLPHGFLCYRPPIPKDEVPVRAAPCHQNGYITFGSFNNMAKVSPETITMWAGLLKAVPNSRLMLKSLFVAETESWNNIVGQLKEQGVDPRRIHIEPRTQYQQDHLNLYNKVDIALDTYPYHGTTTTTEALYMGVPVITLAGDRHASRVSASLLSRIGLNDLVAEDMDDYVRIARELAEDRKGLDEIRAGMRSRLELSPLMDEEHFTRTVEQALRTMWQRRCTGKQPEVFEVSSDKAYDFSNVKAEIPVPSKAPASCKSNQSELDTEMSRDNNLQNAQIKTSIQKQQSIINPGTKMYKIHIKGDVAITVPSSLENMTTYVLLEQEDWFEAETEFAQAYIQPGMNALDIGACFGVYALPMAEKTGPDGKVYAFEPGRQALECLARSRQVNSLNNIEVVAKGLADISGNASLTNSKSPELAKIGPGYGEQVELTTLDAWWQEAGKPGIDFVKLDSSGYDFKILQGGDEFFQENSPVVLFSRNEQAVQHLESMGFGIYQYLKGLGLLIPYEDPITPDPFNLNLVAARPEQAKLLRERGLLADGSSSPLEPAPDTWQNLPWVKDMDFKTEGNEQYFKALNYLCAAQTEKTPAADRPALINKALDLFQQEPESGSQSFCLARCLFCTGQRKQAVQTLQKLQVSSDPRFDLPFLPPLPEQDQLEVQEDSEGWIEARKLEALIKLRHFSGYFSGKPDLPILKNLHQNPERGIEFQRRLALVAMRQGQNVKIKDTSPLMVEGDGNRNVWFWQGLVKEHQDNLQGHDGPYESSLEGIKLHIGGKEPKKGWKILNIFPGKGVDFVGDVKDLSRFGNNSCSEIYASHVLEHISQTEMLPTLKGLHRILKPGGKIMISVPDLDVLCRHFTDPKLTSDQRFHVMRMMFGGQTDKHDFHYIGLNYDFLNRYLIQAGFENIEKVKDFGLFNDTSNFAPYGELISLNLIAYKKTINKKGDSKNIDPVKTIFRSSNQPKLIEINDYSTPYNESIFDLLPKDDLINILDIGAMSIGEGSEPYSKLVSSGYAKIIGFEPNEDECEKMNAKFGKPHHFYPFFIGDGNKAIYYETNTPMTGSLFRPNKELRQKLQMQHELCTLQKEHEVKTRRLDDIPEITNIDFIKIDVQGAELSVFRGAGEALRSAMLIQTEVSFIEQYHNQPLFADVDQYIRSNGFFFHTFLGFGKRCFKPLMVNNNPYTGLRQFLWSDAVYTKDIMQLDAVPSTKLQKLAVMLHVMYGSYDLSHYIFEVIENREKSGILKRYQTILKESTSKKEVPRKENVSISTTAHAAKSYQACNLKCDPKSKIFWIASYPKSGNTWMRFLIGNMLYGDMTSSLDIEQKLPDVHKHNSLNIQKMNRAFLKTHWMWRDSMPGSNHTAGAICIIRNPFDVLVSNMNYLHADTDLKKNKLIDEFILFQGIKRWIDLGFGTWPQHIDSWCFTEHNFPVFFIRYEDLLEDDFNSLKKLNSFLNLNLSDEKINSAIKLSEFNRIKKMEETELQNKQPGLFLQNQGKSESNFRFMNKGKHSTFFDILSEEHLFRLNEKFKPLMTPLGYRLDIKNKKLYLDEPSIQRG